MSRQIIVNSPADSGNGDSLFVSMNKINANFAELYSGMTGSTITKTSDLQNDGADGTHPYITAQDIPASYPMSAITNLNTTIQTLTNRIVALEDQVQEQTTDIVILNSTISTLTGIINTQNGQIATMQADIADIYNIINNL